MNIRNEFSGGVKFLKCPIHADQTLVVQTIDNVTKIVKPKGA